MTTLKQLKPILNYVKKEVRPIIRNILVTDKGLIATNFETMLLIKNTFGLKSGLHDIETLGLINDPSLDNIEDYPIVEFELDPLDKVSTTFQMLNNLLPFCSKDETRIHLSGIAVDNDSLVACDGFTLNYYALNQDIKHNYIIPNSSIELLLKLIKKFKIESKEIVLKLNEEYLLIENENFSLLSRLIARDYAKWNGVIPKKYSNSFEVTNWIDYKELKPLFNKRTNACSIQLKKGKVLLNIPNYPKEKKVIGTCDESLKTEIGFNVKYLDRAANGCNQFTIRFNNELSPTSVNNAIVMPMKL
tara:strand:- start:48 stop:956 length:909 start_codon:yes stop_codon:yes gene_type:complete